MDLFREKRLNQRLKAEGQELNPEAGIGSRRGAVGTSECGFLCLCHNFSLWNSAFGLLSTVASPGFSCTHKCNIWLAYSKCKS